MGVVVDKVVERGPPGASAYEVAVAQGFTGTIPEWLASLAMDSKIKVVANGAVPTSGTDPEGTIYIELEA